MVSGNNFVFANYILSSHDFKNEIIANLKLLNRSSPTVSRETRTSNAVNHLVSVLGAGAPA